MNSESLKQPPPDSLDWLAFRYIADEMSADERESFESRLGDDQPAREAVARIVEVTQAVSLVEAAASDHRTVERSSPVVVTRPDRRTWLTALGWMTVGSIVCLAVLFSADQWSKQRFGDVRQIARSTGEDLPPQLAIVWSETRRTAEPEDGASPSASSDGVDFSSEAREETADEPAWTDPMSSSPAETPSWMIAAVAEDGAAVTPAPTSPAGASPAGASPAKEP